MGAFKLVFIFPWAWERGDGFVHKANLCIHNWRRDVRYCKGSFGFKYSDFISHQSVWLGVLDCMHQRSTSPVPTKVGIDIDRSSQQQKVDKTPHPNLSFIFRSFLPTLTCKDVVLSTFKTFLYVFGVAWLSREPKSLTIGVHTCHPKQLCFWNRKGQFFMDTKEYVNKSVGSLGNNPFSLIEWGSIVVIYTYFK